jgi:uncharacterized protein YkwD
LHSRVLGTLLFLFIIGIGQTLADTHQDSEPETLLESLLSQARSQENLPSLTRDVQADRTAALYAAELARLGVLSHRDGRGRSAADRFAWTGRLVTVGEILGAGEDLKSLVPAWMASQGHRNILLSSRWDSWGLGLARSGRIWVAVVLFLEGGHSTGHSDL